MIKLILVSTKVTPEALKLLRIIAALTGEKQYAVLERVLKAELERIHKEQAWKSSPAKPTNSEYTPPKAKLGSLGNSLTFAVNFRRLLWMNAVVLTAGWQKP